MKTITVHPRLVLVVFFICRPVIVVGVMVEVSVDKIIRSNGRPALLYSVKLLGRLRVNSIKNWICSKPKHGKSLAFGWTVSGVFVRLHI